MMIMKSKMVTVMIIVMITTCGKDGDGYYHDDNINDVAGISITMVILLLEFQMKSLLNFEPLTCFL